MATPTPMAKRPAARPRCPTCSAPYYRWSGAWRPPEYCEHGHPPRGEKVIHGRAPGWFRAKLRAKYREEVGANRHRGLAESLIFDHYGRSGKHCNFFDHTGRDAQGNFVAEPYAVGCPECLEAAEQLAQKLELRVSITRPSFWCPWSDECVRITFFKPEILGASAR